MTPQPQPERQNGAITLLVAMGLVILASLTSMYSARSILVDQLATHNHAHATQAQMAADAALARAQRALTHSSSDWSSLLQGQAPCPERHSGPQWECSRWVLPQLPTLPEAELSAIAVRDVVGSPHVLMLQASARIRGRHSTAYVRESVFIPTVAPAPERASPAALVVNGCVSEAVGARLRVCPLVGSGAVCTGSAAGPAVQTHFVQDTDLNGTLSAAEKDACLALHPSSLPGAGQHTGPTQVQARSPCNRAAWRSVLGDITDAQLQAWSEAQERNGLTEHTTPARTVYWVDSPSDWQRSVGTPEWPVLLAFSAKACAHRCPSIQVSARIVGSVLLDSACDDEKMRGWQAGTIDGQLVVESGMPAWQQGTLLARPDVRKTYVLNWPAGIDAAQPQRINGSWSRSAP